jgi:hypothetical protein
MDANNEAQATLWALKGALTELPAADQAKVIEAKEKLQAVLKEYGDSGKFALGLIGAEMALEAS